MLHRWVKYIFIININNINNSSIYLFVSYTPSSYTLSFFFFFRYLFFSGFHMFTQRPSMVFCYCHRLPDRQSGKDMASRVLTHNNESAYPMVQPFPISFQFDTPKNEHGANKCSEVLRNFDVSQVVLKGVGVEIYCPASCYFKVRHPGLGNNRQDTTIVATSKQPYTEGGKPGNTRCQLIDQDTSIIL